MGTGRRRSPVGGIRAGFAATRRSVKTAIHALRSACEGAAVQLACRELREDRNDEPGKAADQRAVDADVLQVRADVALELGDQLLFLPAHDLVFDEAPDLRAMLLHQHRRALEDLLIQPALQLAIAAQR